MRAPDVVLRLVEAFHDNIDDYKKGRFTETDVRVQYLNPLFDALGWDVSNQKKRAEAYKDVVHEDAIKVGERTKAPDYCFRIGGTRKFFLEAKKPSVNIRDDIHPVYQLKRYAWSAKLPLSILSDFEEFSVYDCRNRPKQGEKSGVGRFRYFTYEEYEDNWEEIEGVFSREAVLRGAFDRFVQSNRAKRGTMEVDDAFLGEIEIWREVLARNIALRNSGLSERQLNQVVQATIDRIIFLRICEDRGIEPYGNLRSLAKGGNVYGRLFSMFQDADVRYNSGLFHFEFERGRDDEDIDNISPALIVDDEKLRPIFKS